MTHKILGLVFSSSTFLWLIVFIALVTGEVKPTKADEFGPNQFPAMVVLDPDSLSELSFTKTVDAILAGREGTTAIELVQSLIDTFQLKNGLNTIDMPIATLADDINLTASQLLDPDDKFGLVPTAVFNRLDLAPDDYTDCGEFRIVYSFNNIVPSPSKLRRFFLIIEARPENPSIANNQSALEVRREHCKNIAKFWVRLGKTESSETKGHMLEQFFYKGKIDGAVVFKAPVINSINLGLNPNLGQVRGNVKARFKFDQGQEETTWQMREWKFLPVVENALPKTLKFVSVPLQNSPKIEFFENILGSPADEENQKREFHEYFTQQMGKTLIDPQPDVTRFNVEWFINNLGGELLNRKFNEFQNITSTLDWRDRIDKRSSAKHKYTTIFRLAKTVLDNTSNLKQQAITPEQLLNRSHMLSCGGCHNPVGEQDLGELIDPVTNQLVDITWPKSLDRFVHVSEPSASIRISEALRFHFLPFREKLMSDFVDGQYDSLAVSTGNGQESLNGLVAPAGNPRMKRGAFVRFRRVH